MTAFLSIIPAWAWKLLAAVALLVGIYGLAHHQGDKAGAARVQGLWDVDKEARDKAAKEAIAQRYAENTAQAVKQAEDNAAITKAHDDEISAVRAQLVAAQRMRRPAFCADAGPASPANPASTAGGDQADTGGGLLPVEVERNIKALIMETEEAAATGRACQSFIHDNGMVQ